jgi:hypothetical protein
LSGIHLNEGSIADKGFLKYKITLQEHFAALLLRKGKFLLELQ